MSSGRPRYLSKSQGRLLERLRAERVPVRVRASHLPTARALVARGFAVELSPLFPGEVARLDSDACDEAAFAVTPAGRRLAWYS